LRRSDRDDGAGRGDRRGGRRDRDFNPRESRDEAEDESASNDKNHKNDKEESQ
jgi:hypothetical protein